MAHVQLPHRRGPPPRRRAGGAVLRAASQQKGRQALRARVSHSCPRGSPAPRLARSRLSGQSRPGTRVAGGFSVSCKCSLRPRSSWLSFHGYPREHLLSFPNQPLPYQNPKRDSSENPKPYSTGVKSECPRVRETPAQILGLTLISTLRGQGCTFIPLCLIFRVL